MRRELIAETSAAVDPEMPEKRYLGDDRDHRETTADAAHDRDREIDDALGDAAGFHQGAGEDEQRDRQQHEGVDAAEQLDGQDDQAHAADAEEVRHRRECKRKGKRHSKGGRYEESRDEHRDRRGVGEKRYEHRRQGDRGCAE